MTVFLEWRTPSDYDPSRVMIKGTRLAVAIYPRFNSRFAIRSVRAYDADRQSTELFHVADASTVNDEQVKRGIEPKVVFQSFDLDEIFAFIEREGVK